MSATKSAAVRSPVIVGTDLTEHADAALVRGHRFARATSAPFVVMHVVPDVMRHHPLLPIRGENDTTLGLAIEKKAADLVTEQVGRVLRLGVDDYRVRIEVGDVEDEIVRAAEEEHACLVTVGASPRDGSERALGHVAERVVRYGHSSVLVARPGEHTNKVLVATDFTEGALPALRMARTLVSSMGATATLVHVMQLPSGSAIVPALSALGSPWVPPAREAVAQLEALGREMLQGLAQEYGFQGYEQLEGDPAHVLTRRAEELDVDVLVVGSHGRTGLRRLVLGSVAERVLRTATMSVLVCRPG